MSKITERVIAKRLQEHTEELQTVPRKQFGFRQQHSFEYQVLRLVEYAANGLVGHMKTDIVFLDVAKGYGTTASSSRCINWDTYAT